MGTLQVSSLCYDVLPLLAAALPGIPGAHTTTQSASEALCLFRKLLILRCARVDVDLACEPARRSESKTGVTRREGIHAGGSVDVVESVDR